MGAVATKAAVEKGGGAPVKKVVAAQESVRYVLGNKEPIFKQGDGGWAYLQYPDGSIKIVETPDDKKNAKNAIYRVGHAGGINKAITNKIGPYPGTNPYPEEENQNDDSRESQNVGEIEFLQPNINFYTLKSDALTNDGQQQQNKQTLANYQFKLKEAQRRKREELRFLVNLGKAVEHYQKQKRFDFSSHNFIYRNHTKEESIDIALRCYAETGSFYTSSAELERRKNQLYFKKQSLSSLMRQRILDQHPIAKKCSKTPIIMML